VDGNPRSRKPLVKGMVLVRITTSARVYSPTANPELVVDRSGFDAEAAEMLEREQELLRLADQYKNPVLDGEWSGPPTVYDEVFKKPKKPAAAAKPAA